MPSHYQEVALHARAFAVLPVHATMPRAFEPLFPKRDMTLLDTWHLLPCWNVLYAVWLWNAAYVSPSPSSLFYTTFAYSRSFINSAAAWDIHGPPLPGVRVAGLLRRHARPSLASRV